MHVLIRVAALAELAEALRGIHEPLTERWDIADRHFQSWIAQPDLLATLRNHLLGLEPAQADAVTSRSRETTTHFAWCLRDRPGEPFTFWLHEYKSQREWRAGYADSVHNHRYHFSTTIVRGGYLHERYRADIDQTTGLVRGVVLVRSTPCEAGAAGMVLTDEFHRIPIAADDTVTFLVKSRAVTAASLSYDPNTRIGHRHVPVEARLHELATTL